MADGALKMATVKGTDKVDSLKVLRGDGATALAGNDTINLMTADPLYSNTASTPFGVIDGGDGTDTLVLRALKTDDWDYVFTELRSVEKLIFTNALDYTAEAAFLVQVPLAAKGTVAAGAAMAITGSAGSNQLLYYVTGGMGKASTITLPDLSFTGFDLVPSTPTGGVVAGYVPDFVALSAGDARKYILKASDAIGSLGIHQRLSGNVGNDTLIGSVGSDNLSGSAGNDTLSGNDGDDTLSGGPGTDKLYGNNGNDVLVIRSDSTSPCVAGDVFDGGAGMDTLLVTGSNRAVNFAGTLVSIEGIRLGSPCELTLTGDQMKMLPATLRFSGVANATLNIINANVFSAAKFTFDIYQQTPKLTISGTAGADTLTGHERDDVLRGGDGDDRLSGGWGSDTLYGNGGVDTLTGDQNGDRFVFDTGTGAVARDTIVDFNHAEGDRIVLTQSGFAEVHQTGGVLNAEEFYAIAGGKAHDADDRIIYNTTTGTIFYDADGSGTQAAVAIVTLKYLPVLAATDIIVM